MEISCPACGKNNQTQDSPSCARCGCDLASLRLIMTGAVWHLKESVRQLRTGNWGMALQNAEQSWALYHSPRAAQAAFLAATAMGRTGNILLWRHRAGEQQ